MDYSEILHALQSASPFDLYRLRMGIDGMLDQPERMLPIKRQLRPGMTISYFSGRKNRLVDAVVEEVQRTWCIPFWMSTILWPQPGGYFRVWTFRPGVSAWLA